MSYIVNGILLIACGVLTVFGLIATVYGLVLHDRANRKKRLVYYVLKQAELWSEDIQIDKPLNRDDLFSTAKMTNTGIGNDGSELEKTNYAANVPWLLKI